MWTPNHGHTNDLSWFLNLFSSSHLLSWPSFLIQTCCCSGSRLLVILANFKDLDGIASRLRVFHLSTLHPSLQTKKKKKFREETLLPSRFRHVLFEHIQYFSLTRTHVSTLLNAASNSENSSSFSGDDTS